MYIFMNAAFYLEGIQRSSLIIKKMNKQSKTGILMKLTTNLVITPFFFIRKIFYKKMSLKKPKTLRKC